jgi:putative SOS response-associated peptidase YedK
MGGLCRVGSTGQRFAISRKDGQPTAVVGLWESFRRPGGAIDHSHRIITPEANALIAALHDRKLIVLAKADCSSRRNTRPT